MEKFHNDLLRILIDNNDKIGFTPSEILCLHAMKDANTIAEIAEKLDLSGSRASQHAQNLKIRLRMALKSMGQTEQAITDRHPIAFHELPNRIRNVMRGMIPRPVYWEDLSFMRDRLQVSRGFGNETYDFVKSRITELCDVEFHLPDLPKPPNTKKRSSR